MLLRLDSSLCYWIFFPITLITICVGLLMKSLAYLFNHGPKSPVPSDTDKLADFDYKKEMENRDVEIKLKSALNRSNLLKKNFMYISEKGFKLRKAFFCKEEVGFFSQTYEKKADLMNPNQMINMVKKTVLNYLYYIIIFVGGGYFFSGFILLKLPFGLTQKFRSMMQQGLNLPDVDVSYVSAISWCLILVFGIDTILQHFDGGEAFSMMKQQEQMMTAQMDMMPANPLNPNNKYENMLKSEREAISILPQFSLIEDAVERLIEKYEPLI